MPPPINMTQNRIAMKLTMACWKLPHRRVLLAACDGFLGSYHDNALRRW